MTMKPGYVNELERFEAMPRAGGPDLRASAEALRGMVGSGARREPPKESGKRLATIPRGDDAELRIVWDEYEGRPYVAIRLWEGRPGAMYPTKTGCTVRVRELADFAEGIAAAIEEAKAWAASRGNGQDASVRHNVSRET